MVEERCEGDQAEDGSEDMESSQWISTDVERSDNSMTPTEESEISLRNVDEVAQEDVSKTVEKDTELSDMSSLMDEDTFPFCLASGQLSDLSSFVDEDTLPFSLTSAPSLSTDVLSDTGVIPVEEYIPQLTESTMNETETPEQPEEDSVDMNQQPFLSMTTFGHHEAPEISETEVSLAEVSPVQHARMMLSSFPIKLSPRSSQQG